MAWAVGAKASVQPPACDVLRPARSTGPDAGRASSSRAGRVRGGGGGRHEVWAPRVSSASAASVSATAVLAVTAPAETAPAPPMARRRRRAAQRTGQGAVKQRAVAASGRVVVGGPRGLDVGGARGGATVRADGEVGEEEEEEDDDSGDAEQERWVAVQRLKVANAVREILEKSVVGGVVSDDIWAANVPGAGEVERLRAMLAEGEAGRVWLVERHSGLVHAAAFKLRGFVDRDAVQEGLVGLVRAIDMFDPTRGLRFSTYALHWIRARILRADEQHRRTIRLAAGVHWKAVKAERLSAQGLGPDAVARELGVSRAELSRLRRLGADTVSLSTPAFVENGYLTTIEDELPSTSSLTGDIEAAGGMDALDVWQRDDFPSGASVLADFERDLTRSALTDLLEQNLSRLEHAVLALRFGLACPPPAGRQAGFPAGGGDPPGGLGATPAFSVRDVSKILGLGSHVAVVRAEERALRKLRNVPDLYALLSAETAEAVAP